MTELVLKIMKENWVSVKGYQNLYEVSDQGRVRSLDRVVFQKNRFNLVSKRLYKGRILKARIGKQGYPYLHLSKAGVRKTFKIHRLVAEHFVPNLECKPEVNHIDGDKTNNITDNLEWCTSSENKRHAHRTGLKSNPKGVDAHNFRGTILAIKSGEVLCELNGHEDIHSKGFTSCGVSATLTGRQKTHRGCTFILKEDYENEINC